MKKSLQKFYQAVADDPTLIAQIETIVDKQDFSKLLVQLGAEKGYHFTSSEVESSIKDNTASEQGEYFCLPIGCWHKPQLV